MVRAGLRYFVPNHSPLNEGSTEQALVYLANMPSATQNMDPVTTLTATYFDTEP